MTNSRLFSCSFLDSLDSSSLSCFSPYSFFYETKCASKGSQVFARCAIRAGKAIRNLRNEFHSIEAHQSTSTMIYSNKTTTKIKRKKNDNEME